ncbi:MAG TPA: hypothetical protein VJS39_13845 [Gemmatimonadaceae bacterium]|nr:hypothetical protein [Gemmatimonadaceae bacterium]
MDLGELIALSGILLGGLTLAGGIFGAWAFGRMQGERKALETRADSNSDERFVRLERMIEAMALDMERLAEAQRYIARQLPRGESSAPKPANPDSTPRM